jgi:hypothetical protein
MRRMNVLLVRNQIKTYATMKNLNKSNVFDVESKEKIPLSVVQLDVYDYASVTKEIDTILKENG